MVSANLGAKGGHCSNVRQRNILHYRLGGKLGAGMALVHKAVDTRLNRTVALKFLSQGGAHNGEARERLRVEARAAAKLDHPNIGTLHALEQTPDGQLFLVMAFYQGQALEDRLTRGPLTLAAALDIALQTAAGLNHAHSAGIVHRDIKPANLMLTDEGQVKILDFGLAQLKKPEDAGDDSQMIGSMAYMAPEQVQGRTVGPGVDLWSLGVVLYESLTGVSPFVGEGHTAATLLRIFNHQPKPITELRPELPPPLDEVLAKLLAKNPGRRYDSALALRADLETLRSKPITVEEAAREPTTRPLPSTDVPLPRTPLVGRADEMKVITQNLSDASCQVLTLLGPGGTGKTHLSLAVAQQQHQLGLFSDGIFLVELDALGDAELLPSRIAEALDLTLRGDTDPLEQLIGHFGRRKALLILDNFEQVIEGTGIVSELVNRCSDLKILIASRERLGIEEEQIVPIPGLPVPEQLDESVTVLVSRFGALELFEQRAQRVKPDFTITYESLSKVIDICRLTMGLPLGIELAAAWVRTMTLSAIAQEISMNRDFLASSSRDVPERHRSVRSVFSHSWQRLTGEEQETLLKLSVFRGGICAEAAAEVAGANLALLTGLVDKSLLTPSTDDRYEQHTLLQQYAEERLAEKPEALVRAQQKHSRYFVEYLADQGHQLRGPGQGEALAAIELELRNIRSAWSWAVANVEAALLGQASEPFRLFHDQRDLILEGLEQFSRATEALHSVEESAEAMLGRVLVDRAWLDLRAGHYQAAIALAALGLDHLRPHNETRSVILGINAFGAATARRGQYSEALPKFNEALALAQEISDTNLEALSLDNLASTEQARGHTREAERYYRRSLDGVAASGRRSPSSPQPQQPGIPGAECQESRRGRTAVRRRASARSSPRPPANLSLPARQPGPRRPPTWQARPRQVQVPRGPRAGTPGRRSLARSRPADSARSHRRRRRESRGGSGTPSRSSRDRLGSSGSTDGARGCYLPGRTEPHRTEFGMGLRGPGAGPRPSGLPAARSQPGADPSSGSASAAIAICR